MIETSNLSHGDCCPTIRLLFSILKYRASTLVDVPAFLYVVTRITLCVPCVPALALWRNKLISPSSVQVAQSQTSHRRAASYKPRRVFIISSTCMSRLVQSHEYTSHARACETEHARTAKSSACACSSAIKPHSEKSNFPGEICLSRRSTEVLMAIAADPCTFPFCIIDPFLNIIL